MDVKKSEAVFQPSLYIKNKIDGSIHRVWKYIDNEDEIIVWSHTWYGKHIIGDDCEFINKQTK